MTGQGEMWAESTSTAVRLEANIARSHNRVLIIGAGIAGATLAALLYQQGQPAAVIEQHAAGDDEGYMLGLLPLGGRVLDQLSLTDGFEARSVPMHNYDLFAASGRLIRRYPLDRIVRQYGDWRGVERTELVSLLRHAGGPIEYMTTVRSLHNREDGVEVEFSDGSQMRFDAVIGADGIHSATREIILSPDQTTAFRRGWGGYVAWATPAAEAADTYSELWGDGWGIGLYPVRDRIGVFLAGRTTELEGRDAGDYADDLRRRVPDQPFGKALANLDSTDTVYWRMNDIRATQWSRGRIGLLGDAATAFLPTAGLGASAAMESATVLARLIQTATPADLPSVLEEFEKSERPRVEKLQQNSRNLARLMFVNSRPATMIRDMVLRFYSIRMLTRSIARSMEKQA